MRPSIRRRLLFILLPVTSLIWGAAAVTGYYDARHEVTELFDAQLAQSARSLLILSRHELEELHFAGVPTGAHVHFIPESLGNLKGHEYEHKVAYQIWLTDEQKLVVRSDTAPPKPLSDTASGFSDRIIDGQRWRVFSLTDPESGFRIQMGESYEIREELVDHIALRLTVPVLAALPLFAILIGLGVGGALKPLTRVAEAIGRRAPDRLDPVEDENVPVEAVPLVEALNRLLDRVSRALESERRFTADAAHEMRTPLAGIKAQAQVARRSDSTAVQRQALDQVARGVDRATHLVDELLLLARLDPDQRVQDINKVDLCALAANIMAELAQLSAEQRVELELVEPCNGAALGSPELLKLLLRNLVDNALRYTPDGGRCLIETFMDGDRACVRVHDSGPGIPDKERARVFQRFYRGGQASGGGSGLGLSIVKRIAEIHGGRVRLGDSRLGGLVVEVCLPGFARGYSDTGRD